LHFKTHHMQNKGLHQSLFKALKIFGISILSVIALLAVIPLFFSSTINEKVKDWANNNINGELAFRDLNLSFFKHFPSLTVTMYDVNLKGSAPFKDETLIDAKEIALGIDLSTLFEQRITINKFYVSEGLFNIQTDSLGNANYNVYKSQPEAQESTQDSSSASLGIELIRISKSKLVYNDRSLPMFIEAKGFNYTGKGDLSKDIFDLYTQADIDSLDFTYAGQEYIKNKKINASLITQINTGSLAFIFEKNELTINRLPVTFTGKFGFLSNGYDINFHVTSNESPLKDIFTAFPQEFLAWADKTDLKGKGEVDIALAGKYIAEQHTMPDFRARLKIREGYIKNQRAPSPITNLFLNIDADLPGLDPQKINLNIDSIFFNMGEDYFSGILKLKGLDRANIYSRIRTRIDLEKFDQAAALDAYDLKGILNVDLIAQGNYATGVKPYGLRKKDTVITSIPTFKFKGQLKNGYFKMANLPQAVENISFNLDAEAADSLYQNTRIHLSDINMNVLANYLKGYIKIGNLKTYPVDAKLESSFNLADISSFYPLDSIELKGNLLMNLLAKGTYEPEKRRFPVSTIELSLKDGYIKSLAYPLPLEKISLVTHISNSRGSYKDLNVKITPISFLFSGQPFMLKADLQNLDNLKYNISSKGSLDLGKIYQVFAMKGYDVKGFIKTDLSLKGRQSDAMAGRYNLLNNRGRLEVKNIDLSSDLFPKPLTITSGKFSFNQDKMRFDAFKGLYGESNLFLTGFINNVTGYLSLPNSPLKGKFTLTSPMLNANEFMAFADTETSSQSAPADAGVVLIPANLDIDFNAAIKQIKYDGLLIKNFTGQLLTKDQALQVNQAAFDLVGTKVSMNASYKPLTPKKANFSYDLKADNFDIQRAWKELPLFREMASSAEKMHGTISIAYQLSGQLNESMYPVMPSVKGSGTLTLQKIKFRGFKLMNGIAKSTSSESLQDPEVSKVEIKSSIQNNIMTIERTRMRMAGFRGRFEGQVSLDGNMNMGFRLGLPPLGIIGIPIKITGTQENPKIKLGKQSKEDELEETTEENQH
jgi:AsmA protein